MLRQLAALHLLTLTRALPSELHDSRALGIHDCNELAGPASFWTIKCLSKSLLALRIEAASHPLPLSAICKAHLRPPSTRSSLHHCNTTGGLAGRGTLPMETGREHFPSLTHSRLSTQSSSVRNWATVRHAKLRNVPRVTRNCNPALL